MAGALISRAPQRLLSTILEREQELQSSHSSYSSQPSQALHSSHSIRNRSSDWQSPADARGKSVDDEVDPFSHLPFTLHPRVLVGLVGIVVCLTSLFSSRHVPLCSPPCLCFKNRAFFRTTPEPSLALLRLHQCSKGASDSAALTG